MPVLQPRMIAPEFALKDFNGHEMCLSNFRNKKNVLIIFNRGFM